MSSAVDHPARPSAPARDPVVLLAGNPNSGKTTVFNRLTGLRQRVGNYPGVTVEKKSGTLLTGERRFEIVDLPGTYSLVARSHEEAIAYELISGRPAPDLIVVVVDASNLERNLYLTLQILETGRPAIVALNLMDAAEEAGIELAVDALARRLGVPVVPIVAKRGEGIDRLVAEIERSVRARPVASLPPLDLPAECEAKLDELAAKLTGAGIAPRAEAAWLAGSIAAAAEQSTLDGADDPLLGRSDLAALGRSVRGTLGALPSAIIEARYRAIESIAGEVVRRRERRASDVSAKVDRVLLHRVAGPLVFVTLMALLFQSLFAWAEPLMDAIEGGIAAVGGAVAGVLPEGLFASLVVDGVIAGVGSVLVFVPQIAILFAVIAILEDTGYLARAAYIMDRVMAKAGLHGRAFVPLMSGFACAVPAIMSARTIESTKDRLVTVLVTPLISCSARLPVYLLMIPALFGAERVLGVRIGVVLLLAMYALSVLAAVSVAFVLKRTVLASPTPPLVLELPPYRMPDLGGVLRRVFERVVVFVRDAGTVILACSIVLWALLAFPREAARSIDPAAARAEIAASAADADAKKEQLAALDARLEGERIGQSYAARLGKLLEPLIEPLGFDWRIGIGLVASFAAREVLVSTLGLVFGIGAGADEESEGLRAALRGAKDERTGRRLYTPLVGLALMVFFLFACQCMSTLAVIRRETNSWRWPAFSFGYMTVLAWLGSFAVYQGGRLLGFE